MNRILLATLLISIQSCSSLKVISDVDKSEDFTVFKTFEYDGWSDDLNVNSLERERIEKAFYDEITQRGLTLVDKGEGDVIVALFLTGEVKTQRTAQTTGTGMGMTYPYGRRGMMGPGWGWGMSHSTTVINETEYLEGSVGIEMYDIEDKKLIWQAIGTSRVNDNPQKRAQVIPRKVKEIMKRYPVKPIKQ